MPIILGLVAQNIINVTDTIFLGHLSQVALGAGAIGGLFYFSFIILGAGLGTGTQIIIGRRNGENDSLGVQKTFTNGMYIALIMSSLLLLLLICCAPFFLGYIVSSENILTEAAVYVNYRKWGIIVAYISIILKSLFIGTLKTKVLIYSTLFMSAVNVFLDYALIFGAFGFPELGVGGAAIASVIAECSDLLFLLVWLGFSKSHNTLKLFRFYKPDIKLSLQLFKISYPLMLQYFFSFGGWFFFFLIIEKIGETELAVSNIVRSFYMVIMIPVWGLSSATNSLVSNLIGSGNRNHVGSLLKRMTLLSVTATVIIVLMYSFIPEIVIGFYTNDALLISASIPVLRVISFSVILFAASYIIFSGVSGTGNTMYAFLIEAVTIVVYVVATYWFGIVLKTSLAVVWFSEVFYFIVLGGLSVIYFKKFNWKKIKI